MHMMKYYIKRCLGLPGDSLSIVNGYYRVNGIFEPVGNIEGQELFSVQSNKMLKDAGLYWSFPEREKLRPAISPKERGCD